MKTFPKRRYHGIGEFFRDAGAVWRARREILGILRGKTIAPDFRERLMLAVTAVNQCRYCTFVHTRAALKSGVSRGQIDSLFAQGADVPARERTAMLYAQHWAETKGTPDADAQAALEGEYGAEEAARINATLRFIYLNNLCGNTFDCLLHTVSFGLLGGV
jgi:AhpD family alkylhydroperoxidase